MITVNLMKIVRLYTFEKVRYVDVSLIDFLQTLKLSSQFKSFVLLLNLSVLNKDVPSFQQFSPLES